MGECSVKETCSLWVRETKSSNLFIQIQKPLKNYNKNKKINKDKKPRKGNHPRSRLSQGGGKGLKERKERIVNE